MWRPRRCGRKAPHPSAARAAALATDFTTMSEQPHWKANFPVRQSAEHAVSRRQFCKIACGCAVAVGAGVLAKDRLFPVPTGAKPLLISRVDHVPVGGYKLFSYPTEHHPCILVRLGENEFAAYSQSCTHLMCPVNYHHEKKQF